MAYWDEHDVERELPVLRRYARALTRDEAAADDLVQEALIRALERADTFAHGRSLKTWLLAIVHNQFVTSLRRCDAERRRNTSFAIVQRSHQSGLDQETTVYLRQIAALFDALPEHHRSILHLIVVEGLSYQEAADALGIALGTVMSRLSRARTALRRAAEGPETTRALHIAGGRDAS